MEGYVKIGLFRRKVKFRFDLAALKVATAVCKMDLGEFFSSERISDDVRFFYQSYGAWLCGKHHTMKDLKRYTKLFNSFRTSHIQQIKTLKVQGEIISAEYLKAIRQTTATEKKKSLHGLNSMI